MTESELTTWLQSWISDATGADTVDPSVPLDNLGLSSRDVVVLSGELERLLDIKLDPTVAYQYPTVEALAHGLLAPTATGAQRLSTSGPAFPAQRTAGLGSGDIAIVGRAGRFPGAQNVDEFWDLLVSGQSVTGPLPEGRWTEYSQDPVMSAKMREQNIQGGYLDDIRTFDNEFFGLSPLEAENMDPQQRIMLELAWEALEDAHIPANRLRGESVGVFVGSSSNDYGMLITSDPASAHPYALTGTSSAVIPNRISYAFDFRGPSMNVDTACSSSLVSVHHAVRALRGGESDVALAGGVNILASPFISTAFAELGVISPSGKISAFSDDADGFVRAEAAGFIVLKRVEDAIADGDEVLAVIKGSATNSDGHSNGLTAPNPEAQVDVLRRAYADAGIDPAAVDLVEAHGTGTALGDPIEATALGQVLGAGRADADPLLLGSAKSNIGHSESAAGVVAMIKVIEALTRSTVPPTANFTTGNKFIDFDATKIEVVEDPREWPEYSGRRIAGVSGFGFGGTNAHIVVSDFDPAEYDVPARVPSAGLVDPANPDTVLLPVSGLLPSRRRELAAAVAESLTDGTDLRAVARTLAGRNHGRSRAVVTASTVEEARKRLGYVAEGKVTQGVAAADAPSPAGPVFVYSGFGSQHRKMVKPLVELSPAFRARIQELDKVVEFESGWSMLDIILDDEQTYDTETGQVTVTAIQIALTDLLASYGITPAATMGMSMGEIAAAYAADGLSAEDAMLIACTRARLMGEGEKTVEGTEQEGAMAVVELSREELEGFVDKHPEAAGVEPAVYAGPGMTTVGGPGKAVDYLVAALEEESKFARKLNVRGAGHTSMLDPILGELAGDIAGIEPKPLRIPHFGSVDGTHRVGETIHDVDYWIRMTRQPVLFQDATEAALAAGHTILVEISPNPVAIMGMMNTAFTVGKPDTQLLFALKRKESEPGTLLDLAAKLYVSGMPVDFAALAGDGARADVPHTPLHRNELWTSARPSSSGSGPLGAKVTLPDGTIVYAAPADQIFSAMQIVELAAAEVDAKANVVAVEERAPLPAAGELTTMVRRGLGGLTITVYNGAILVAEGFASTLDLGQATLPGVTEAPQPAPEVKAAREQLIRGATDDIDVVRWDPATETVEERLRAIVSESMGYDVDDLPDELPLIDLGLDSLMGMRIKNRVENDFQIPPLQVQALREASVADVIAMVEEAVAGNADGAQPMAENDPHRDPAHAVEKAKDAGAGVGVAPRDASERMVFGAWAKYAGQAAAGVTSPLPEIARGQAEQIAAHLTERSGIEVSADDVLAAETLEPLANTVREGLESPVEGNIRVMRERTDETTPSLFVFHPAGGSSVVYQPLTRRLPDNVPVYGIERLEGTLEDRAAAYIADIERLAAGQPIVLAGWSFGGALAYEVAHQLQSRKGTDAEIPVKFIALLDTTQPSNPTPDTPEETKKRWERYAAFAKDTYGLDFEVPYELLETAGEDAMLQMLADFLATTDASEHGLAAGVLEHQRASFVDNQILAKVDMQDWADVDLPVLLFRAERMHDGAIMLEPAYEEIDPDGGWAAIVEDLTIVQLPGDHLAVVDEPAVGIVGKHIAEWIAEVD
ncbi:MULTISPECIES: polyketide synthase Pks13 [unclassified Corynebacterium]|uniref:polyketide synthase Pks13 n=1 Tax=unclassified Corynebacterium TaxID=2624378 RepID=UPI00264AA8E7|nr:MULTISPECIES: polyketide synthase Pks13 [unclassified Corynebacterium]MDN8595379.1 polyketide synthase Pks13 [Corynebacterium sp. P4_F2]WKK55287.1 polyketide synthase Pks13 [Corynebacterium sp. P4-C1]WKK62695.1 polyketide synthase Pks13 [Corynebacterium sp. P8-C1]